jgi:hypothetical protein
MGKQYLATKVTSGLNEKNIHEGARTVATMLHAQQTLDLYFLLSVSMRFLSFIFSGGKKGAQLECLSHGSESLSQCFFFLNNK